MIHNVSDVLSDRVLYCLDTAVPSLPRDDLNDPIVRRLLALFDAAKALAAAIPDNGSISPSQAACLQAAVWDVHDMIMTVTCNGV